MTRTNDAVERTECPRYDSPELVVIGDAADVVLGVATGGFDGVFQMTEQEFEFEPDGDRH